MADLLDLDGIVNDFHVTVQDLKDLIGTRSSSRCDVCAASTIVYPPHPCTDTVQVGCPDCGRPVYPPRLFVAQHQDWYCDDCADGD
jgi:hypothetical protein